VIRVYAQPDRPKGRGRKVAPPPTKVFAEARGLPCAQPTKLKDGAVAAQLREDAIDLAVVVAYGRILPPAVFEAPALDTWNVHASRLPAYRGAAPIQHAILNGERTTGVTLMQLREGLDEGPMLLERGLEIGPEETAGELTERLAALGAEVLLEGIRAAKSSGLEVTPQDDARATFAPLIDKKDGQLDLHAPAEALARRIRAFDPWPGAFVESSRGPVKILSARAVDAPGVLPPGAVIALSPLRVQTGSGALEIERLQAPGKKPVQAEEFLRGAGRDLAIGAPFPG
jgi:methionyl-tRNA formyltransferase